MAKYSHVTGSNTTVVVDTVPRRLLRVLVNSVNSGSIIDVIDGTSNLTTNLIGSFPTLTAGMVIDFGPEGVDATTALAIAIGTPSVDLTVVYI